MSPKSTALERDQGHSEVSLSMLIPKSSRCTEFIFCKELINSPGSNHTVCTGTVPGFPNHQLLLSLLVLEEMESMYIQHWVLGLKQGY